MNWRLAYYDYVKQDVREAKNWYFKQQPGLEKRFAEDVKQTLDRMKLNPRHYEIKYRNVRIFSPMLYISTLMRLPASW